MSNRKVTVGKEQYDTHKSIIEAYLSGKEIEYKKIDSQEWKDSSTPTWSLDYHYRVKPEPKLVPFTFEDRDIFRDRWFRRKSDGSEFKPGEIYRKYVYFQSEYAATYKDLLDDFEFLDGSPIGKMEGIN